MDKKVLQQKLDYAYGIYSGVKVAACAIDKNGKEYFGVNCENPAFPSGLCAERSALFSSVVDGAEIGSFKEIHVISNLNKILYPCGACVQVLTQFLKKDAKVVLYNANLTQQKEYLLSDIFPYGVRDEDIKD
ncbi:cytidine deaminase [[Mycoplasma] falconis]|uniref:Cytidine deaminase n=1 Tax=[Mycoplasma] falconis TaxID=92403 RepID=A0A501X9R8_9BACT|nr:cytidine deaminase [[Mycoplasma] falconis]TPE57144.1 cytidine deaminase [[Mycoplasma] falconis]